MCVNIVGKSYTMPTPKNRGNIMVDDFNGDGDFNSDDVGLAANGWSLTSDTGQFGTRQYKGNEVLLIETVGKESQMWVKGERSGVAAFDQGDWGLDFNLEVKSDSTTGFDDYMLFNVEDGSHGTLIKIYKDGFMFEGKDRVRGFDFSTKLYSMRIYYNHASNKVSLMVDGEFVATEDGLKTEETEVIFGVQSGDSRSRFGAYFANVNTIS